MTSAGPSATKCAHFKLSWWLSCFFWPYFGPEAVDVWWKPSLLFLLLGLLLPYESPETWWHLVTARGFCMLNHFCEQLFQPQVLVITWTTRLWYLCSLQKAVWACWVSWLLRRGRSTTGPLEKLFCFGLVSYLCSSRARLCLWKGWRSFKIF